jgi:hypothetical protein
MQKRWKTLYIDKSLNWFLYIVYIIVNKALKIYIFFDIYINIIILFSYRNINYNAITNIASNGIRSPTKKSN